MAARPAPPPLEGTDLRTGRTAVDPAGGRPRLPLWELVRTSHVVARRFTEVFARAGLTPQQFGVLASLIDEPDLSQAEIARNVMVRPQSIGRIVHGMIADGLLAPRATLRRGRPSRLRVTPAGRARFDRAWPLVRELNDAPVTGLTAAEAGILIDQLVRLRDRLEGG